MHKTVLYNSTNFAFLLAWERHRTGAGNSPLKLDIPSVGLFKKINLTVLSMQSLSRKLKSFVFQRRDYMKFITKGKNIPWLSRDWLNLEPASGKGHTDIRVITLQTLNPCEESHLPLLLVFPSLTFFSFWFLYLNGRCTLLSLLG